MFTLNNGAGWRGGRSGAGCQVGHISCFIFNHSQDACHLSQKPGAHRFGSSGAYRVQERLSGVRFGFVKDSQRTELQQCKGKEMLDVR